MTSECPTCGEGFGSQKAMKIHHKAKHGQSLATEKSTCLSCDSEFSYYPSNRSGELCHECSDKHSDEWSEHMMSLKGPEDIDGRSSEDSTLHKRRRIQQIKLGVGCSECGYNEHPAALDFHHLENKDRSITRLVSGNFKWSRVLTDLQKCDVLCSNCHRVIHSSA